MSFHLSNLAWDIELRGPQKLVLLCLAHLSVQSTRECSPTIARIAVMCGISDSSVRDQIRALGALGLIEELRNGRIVHYRVNVGAPREADGEA